MNTIKNKTILCRLFAFILFATVFGAIDAEAQQRTNIYLNCNVKDGGFWNIPTVGGGGQKYDHLEEYDGQSDDYIISCYFDNCYRIDTILCNRRGLSDLSQLGNILLNRYGYVFAGWIDDQGNPRDLSTPLCNIDGINLTAVWQQQILVNPRFEWNVSINSPYYYQTQSNGGTTSVDYGSSIYLQASLIPDPVNSVEYDGWSIEYHTSNNEYFSSAVVRKGQSIQLNNANPYTDPGSVVYTIDKINLHARGDYWWIISNYTYEYTLEVGEAPPVDPELRWSASINTSNNHRDYANNTSLTIGPRESIYLSICPTGGNVEYDSWSFEYNAKPLGYYSPINRISNRNCYDFNNGLSYSDFEQIEFEVTNMILYLNNREVRDIRFNNPYTFIVKKDAYVDPDIGLWASINGNSFSLQDNNTTVVLEQDDEISLRACLSGGNYNFTQWSFDYSITPSGYYSQAPLVTRTNCYNFNNGLSYDDFKEIVVNITAIRLYENGILIRTVPLQSPYAFIVQMLINGIEILPAEIVCNNSGEVAIPYKLLYTGNKVQYSVYFDDDAIKAGFKNIVNYSDLPGTSKIVISVPDGVKPGKYSGVIRLKCDDEPLLTGEYSFSFDVIGDSFEITRQPLSEQSTCRGSLIELSVGISGVARSYQWYHNGQVMMGANSPIISTDIGGSYYIQITGDCTPVRSQTAIVNVPESDIKVKWNDVLYIENSSNKYRNFQWYNNGVAINGATHVYFTNKEGLSGDYTVRCFMQDGTFEETCPITFNNLTISRVSVYPTVLKTNEPLTIVIQSPDNDEQAKVEIFSVTGVIVYSTQISDSLEKINARNLTKGSYFVKITLSSGKVFNEKIVVY